MKSLFFRLLALPMGEPEAPPGSGNGTRTFRASKKFLWLRMLQSLVGLVMLLVFATPVILGFSFPERAGSTFGMVEALFTIVPILLALMGGLWAFASAYIDYSLRYYVVTDRSIRIREGAFFLKESTFTIENIQNVRVHQGFLSRILGLYDVIVETAGGSIAVQPGNARGLAAASAHQGVLRGIEKGEEIKEFLSDLVKRAKSSGLGDESEDELSPARNADDAELEMLRMVVSELRTTEALSRRAP